MAGQQLLVVGAVDVEDPRDAVVDSVEQADEPIFGDDEVTVGVPDVVRPSSPPRRVWLMPTTTDPVSAAAQVQKR